MVPCGTVVGLQFFVSFSYQKTVSHFTLTCKERSLLALSAPGPQMVLSRLSEHLGGRLAGSDKHS